MNSKSERIRFVLALRGHGRRKCLFTGLLARADYVKLLERGKSNREAIRYVKRVLARYFYRKISLAPDAIEASKNARLVAFRLGGHDRTI